MKLEKILDRLNSIEKSDFAKIVDKIINNRPNKIKEIDKILSSYSDTNLKKLDSHLFSKVFHLLEEEYYLHLSHKLNNSVSQLDILIDILLRDGNCIMKREWLGKLYEKELRGIKAKIKLLKNDIDDKDLSEAELRQRDFIIYRNCVHTAYNNDLMNSLDQKITSDEKTILNTLAQNFDLSQEEIKLLNYSVIPLKNLDLDQLIDLLKTAGIILYSKKNLTIYIPDEFVRLLRAFRNKEVPDKYLRRILKLVKDPELNLIVKKHGIDRKLSKRDKIKEIIKEGIGIRNILKFDIHKPDTKLTQKKERLNDIVTKGLNITHLKGSKIDEKINNLIDYFNDIERDEKIGISVNGYERLLLDLGTSIRSFQKTLKSEFELQSEDAVSPSTLLDYNIKPRDVLEILEEDDIRTFCANNDISTRGNDVLNILTNYKDSSNLQLEHYVDIAYRNLPKLKENGIRITEAKMGSKFEELTKMIFSLLGFNVDEKLKTSLSTSKDLIDIIIRIDDESVFLVECKTSKDSGYNKFSSIKRQVSAYIKNIEKAEIKVLKTLLIAPDFSPDFISDTEIDYELDMSLIKAQTLIEILEAFESNKKLKKLPYLLFMKDVVINEERIMKSIA
jgi:hypothetical protein